MTTHCLEVHAPPPEVYGAMVHATLPAFSPCLPPRRPFTPKPPLNNKPPQPLPVRLVLSSAATRHVVHYLTGDTPFRARISLRYVCTGLILCAPQAPNSSCCLFALSSSSPTPLPCPGQGCGWGNICTAATGLRGCLYDGRHCFTVDWILPILSRPV
jgi:hypothetical protein